jgi:methylmalonyl-CoA/ethylmalonyl-CoA epimerase
MQVQSIDHIGIAVKDLDAAMANYERTLGVPGQRESLPERHISIAFFQVGESRIELITPTSPESAIGGFLEKRGEGLHHVAYRVADCAAALDEARAAGLRLIDSTHKPGSHGTLVAFVHPAALNGVLTEFVQVVES